MTIRTYQAIGSDDLRYTWQVDGLDPTGEHFPGPQPCRDVLQISIEPVGSTAEGVTGLLPSWHDLVNVDYAAEDERTFDSDGVYSVGGASFELVRSSLASSTPAILANGIKLPSSASISNGAPKADGCCWYADLGLGTTIPARAPLRAVATIAQLSGTLYAAVEPVLGFINAATVGTSYVQAESVRASGSVSTSPTYTMMRSQRVLMSTTQTSVDCGTIPGATQFGLHLPRGVMVGNTVREVLEGDSSDSVETIDLWVAINCVSASQAVDIGDGKRARSEFRPQDWKFFMGCSAGEWTPGNYAVLSRLRVQAFY